MDRLTSFAMTSAAPARHGQDQNILYDVHRTLPFNSRRALTFLMRSGDISTYLKRLRQVVSTRAKEKALAHN